MQNKRMVLNGYDGFPAPNSQSTCLQQYTALHCFTGDGILHSTALNKDSRHSFIKPPLASTSEAKVLVDNANSRNVDTAIRIIKNSLASGGTIDYPLLFQIGEDDGLYQVMDLKETCFQRFRRVL